MRLSFRQYLVLALLVLCAVTTILIAWFGPLQYAIIGLTVTVVVTAGLMLLFLRKVLAAVYRNKDHLQNGQNGSSAGDGDTNMSELRTEISDLAESVALLHQHLPERVAVRLAYEIELGRRGGTDHEQV